MVILNKFRTFTSVLSTKCSLKTPPGSEFTVSLLVIYFESMPAGVLDRFSLPGDWFKTEMEWSVSPSSLLLSDSNYNNRRTKPYKLAKT